MERLTVEERLELHKAYWEGREMSEPIVSFRLGDYFFSDKFKANGPLLKKGTMVTPDMIDVDVYMEDYERMYQDCETTGQSAFFTAEPCTGFPWLEGMLGCPIIGETEAFMALQACDGIEELGDLVLDKNNPWFLKYVEFLDKLVELSGGRFPVGQPIMRGVTDVVGTMAGQSEMACGVMEEPELMHEKFGQAANVLREVIAEQYQHVPPFHGGSAAGFYHLWAPGKLIWYQEDLSAILSRSHYEEFLRETSTAICEGYDYTLTHMHPNSFFHLDGILSLDSLKAVQINKDVSGPNIEQMMPVFQRVIAADKRLVVWGDLNKEEITMLMTELPHKGLFLNIVAPTVEASRELNELIRTLWK